MEAFPSYQSQYQTSPYPLERSNDIPTDLKDANDTGFPNVLSPNNRLHHSLSYPPAASGRSPRNHEVQVARARSRLQPRTSPPAVVRMVSRSPEQQQNTLLDSASSLSAFPLPYRPPKTAARYSSPPIEPYSSPTIPLTSQDTRSYHSSPPFQASPPGRFLDDSQVRGLQVSNSKLDPPGYFSSPQNWQQTRDSKWPQSRSQSRRKYIPKGRRYDSPFHQRNRLGPRHGHFTPPRKEGIQSGYKKRLPGQFYDETAEQLPQPPRLARCPLPSSPLDDQKDASTPERVAPGCTSQYISPDNTDTSLQSIRKSKYWLQMKDDPIFSSNLSIKSELVSIKELVNRRVQMLQDRAHPSLPRQSIMKEQGTQTDIESPALFSHPERPSTAGQNRRVVSSSNTPKHEQPIFAPPPPSPQQKQYHHRQQFQKEKSSSTKDGNRNRHYRTSSLTDTDSPRIIHARQPTSSPRMGGLKRSRSDTEDDYYMSDSCHRRRADDIPLSPGGFFSQRARTPFYSSSLRR